MSYYSEFHKRLLCDECGWFPLPISNPMYCDFENESYEVCPDCGNENLRRVVGRLNSVKVGRSSSPVILGFIPKTVNSYGGTTLDES